MRSILCRLCTISRLTLFPSRSSLIKHAVEHRKPVLLLNVGPTRANQLVGVETIEIPAGSVMREVVKGVL